VGGDRPTPGARSTLTRKNLFLGEKNKFLGEKNKFLGEKNKFLGEKNKFLGEKNKSPVWSWIDPSMGFDRL
jgi:hypothetical protein